MCWLILGYESIHPEAERHIDNIFSMTVITNYEFFVENFLTIKCFAMGLSTESRVPNCKKTKLSNCWVQSFWMPRKQRSAQHQSFT